MGISRKEFKDASIGRIPKDWSISSEKEEEVKRQPGELGYG